MKILVLFFILALSTACRERIKPVANFQDYEAYLSTRQVVSYNPLEEEMRFWSERLKNDKHDEASFVKLAGLHAELFKTTGLINHIWLSDSLYHEVLKKYPEGNVELYHSLSANAISQHKFQKAKNYAEDALKLKDKKAASLLILADVSLEIGDYAAANQILRQFTNKNSFAYLIRKAKLKDHEGMLDSAIICMEKAYQRIKGNSVLSQWALSNLGDMYGHAGRIEEAYEAYLRVLKNNPNDAYALKGIAWISISHDKNISDAEKIINVLIARRRMPEAYLMLGEIAEMKGNESQKLAHIKNFRSLVSSPAYKTMYHKYLSLLEAEVLNNPNLAVSIAKDEIVNRPTPQSYDLLAWSYYHLKQFKKALEIVNRQVENQTFEPDALYHIGMIYLVNDNIDQARHYLSEALKSEFELGPSVSSKIRTALQDL